MERRHGHILFLCNLDNSYIDDKNVSFRNLRLIQLLEWLEEERDKTNSERILWTFYTTKDDKILKKCIYELHEAKGDKSNVILTKMFYKGNECFFKNQNYENIEKEEIFFNLNKYLNEFLTINEVIIADNDLNINNNHLAEIFDSRYIKLINIEKSTDKVESIYNVLIKSNTLNLKKEH